MGMHTAAIAAALPALLPAAPPALCRHCQWPRRAAPVDRQQALLCIGTLRDIHCVSCASVLEKLLRCTVYKELPVPSV
jgi:hypothetical protein